MKKTILLTAVSAVLASVSYTTSANNTAGYSLNLSAPLEKVAPYPQPEVDQNRFAIFLPKLENEDQAKVELVIGKEMLVDCNIHRLGGTVTEETLTGWGYSYYVVGTLTGPMSTMKACPNGMQSKDFVSLTTPNDKLLRYNSKLPIVIYAPKEAIVKYRVWLSTKSSIPAKVR